MKNYLGKDPQALLQKALVSYCVDRFNTNTPEGLTVKMMKDNRPSGVYQDLLDLPFVVVPDEAQQFGVRFHYRDHIGSSSLSQGYSANGRPEWSGDGLTLDKGDDLVGYYHLMPHEAEMTFYDPYGGQIDPNAGHDDEARFTDHEYDSDTGLNYMKGRYQFPMYAKFNRPDPKRDWDWTRPHTLNLYEYVGNDPVNKWDPDGFQENWFEKKIEEVKTFMGISKAAHKRQLENQAKLQTNKKEPIEGWNKEMGSRKRDMLKRIQGPGTDQILEVPKIVVEAPGKAEDALEDAGKAVADPVGLAIGKVINAVVEGVKNKVKELSGESDEASSSSSQSPNVEDISSEEACREYFGLPFKQSEEEGKANSATPTFDSIKKLEAD